MLTDNATKTMRCHGRSGGSLSIITKKLGELAEGHFSQVRLPPLGVLRTDSGDAQITRLTTLLRGTTQSNAKRINSQSDGVPIYKAKLSRNLRLVWQVSVLEERVGGFGQVILVWSVETHQSLGASGRGLGVANRRKGR